MTCTVLFTYQKSKARAACEDQQVVTCTVLFPYKKGNARAACKEQGDPHECPISLSDRMILLPTSMKPAPSSNSHAPSLVHVLSVQSSSTTHTGGYISYMM